MVSMPAVRSADIDMHPAKAEVNVLSTGVLSDCENQRKRPNDDNSRKSLYHLCLLVSGEADLAPYLSDFKEATAVPKDRH
jgi:hypothetical protein